MLGISYIDPIGDICLQDPILSDAVGNAVAVIVGGCVALTEAQGVLDLYLNVLLEFVLTYLRPNDSDALFNFFSLS